MVAVKGQECGGHDSREPVFHQRSQGVHQGDREHPEDHGLQPDDKETGAEQLYIREHQHVPQRAMDVVEGPYEVAPEVQSRSRVADVVGIFNAGEIALDVAETPLLKLVDSDPGAQEQD